MFQNNGMKFMSARNDYEDKNDCNIPFCDKFYDSPSNVFYENEHHFVYKKLKKIIESNEYEIIHPYANRRLSAISQESREKGTRSFILHMVFTSIKELQFNWLLFYPVERLLARHTDVLITVNREDYSRARNFKAGKIEYVPVVWY